MAENIYSKACVKWPLSKRPKISFQNQLSLNAGQSIAEYSKGSILQYFWPSLSYHLSLRYLFCLFLSGRFTQVLLYCWLIINIPHIDVAVKRCKQYTNYIIHLGRGHGVLTFISQPCFSHTKAFNTLGSKTDHQLNLWSSFDQNWWGKINSNFIWRRLKVGERKFAQMFLVKWPRWLPHPYNAMTLKTLLPKPIGERP